MNIKALPYVTLLGLFFGSSMVGSRFGVGQFEPITYIGVRMIISSLMALSVYRIASGRRFPRDRELWEARRATWHFRNGSTDDLCHLFSAVSIERRGFVIAGYGSRNHHHPGALYLARRDS